MPEGPQKSPFLTFGYLTLDILHLTDGFWWNLKTFSWSVGQSVNNIGLGDAGASKNEILLVKS